MNNKIRTRIGVKLGWPLTNAAIAIVYVTRESFDKLSGAIMTVKGILVANGKNDLADRFVCEES